MIDNKHDSIPKSLAPLPVQIRNEWESKIVTTEPPKLIPHTEYHLVCELSANVPILVVLILRYDNVLEYGKLWRSAATQTLSIQLSFHPYDWRNSRRVQVSLYQRVAEWRWLGCCLSKGVDSESLKQDPCQIVDTELPSSGNVTTGVLIELATIRIPNPIIAQLFVIPKSETEGVRGRWRLRPSASIDVPSSLSFLASGRCTGLIIFS